MSTWSNGKSDVGEIAIGEMRVSPMAQREFKAHRFNYLVANFDVEMVKMITVNLRDDGYYYICDGQHRVAALKHFGFGDQKITCDVYTGLTEKEEAELFLKLNDRLGIDAKEHFKVSVTAERATEVEIARIVKEAGLSIGSGLGRINAPATLKEVYEHGPNVLARTLCVIRDGYGDAGLQATVIKGIGMVMARFGSSIYDDRMVAALSSAHGGVSGLVTRAYVIQRQISCAKFIAVSRATIEVINKGKAAKKRLSWDADAEAAAA